MLSGEIALKISIIIIIIITDAVLQWISSYQTDRTRTSLSNNCSTIAPVH